VQTTVTDRTPGARRKRTAQDLQTVAFYRHNEAKTSLKDGRQKRFEVDALIMPRSATMHTRLIAKRLRKRSMQGKPTLIGYPNPVDEPKCEAAHQRPNHLALCCHSLVP
jgi:hypothetical protein